MTSLAEKGSTAPSVAGTSTRTDLVDLDAPAPSRPRRVRVRFSSAVAVATMLVATTGASIAALHQAVFARTEVARYAVSSDPAQWVSVPGAGPTAWYGTSLDVPTNISTATLWVQADQVFQVWVNGRRGPTNAPDVRASAGPSLHALDVLPGLRVGPNGIVVRVTNADGGAPAVLARLVISYSNGTTYTSGTGAPGWRATADASLAGPPGQSQLLPVAPGADWTAPSVLAAHVSARSPLPDWLMDRALIAPVLGAPADASANDVTFTSKIVTPARVAGGWLRIAASSSFDLVVDHHVVASIAADPLGSVQHPRTTLYLVDVGHLLHAGTNDIAIHIHGVVPAMLAVDGSIATRAGDIVVATGPGWSTTSGSAPVALGSVQAIWSSGTIRTVVPNHATGGRSTATIIGFGVVVLLVAWALVSLAVARFGRSVSRARSARMLAVACAPALTLTALIAIASTWSNRSSAFPLTAPAWWLVGIVLVGCWTVTAVALVAPSRAIRTDTHVSEPPSRRLAVVRRVNWATWSVLFAASGATAMQAYDLSHEPLWQDEVTSLVVAHSIKAHGIPLLPSGLTYYKGELYHALLAVATTFTTNVSALRSISLFWFFATIVAFGLLLMPTLARGHKVVQVVATFVFALAPTEVLWARDIRMYQQMQFFAIVFIALFLRATQRGTRRQVIGSALALMAMYLSHEESFIILPAIPVVLAIQWSTRWWRRPVWLVSYGLVAVLIGAQYLLSKLHPASFGQDLSNRAYVGWDPQQATFYYNNVFFRGIGTGTIALVSTLAIVGAVVGLVQRDRTRSLAAAVLLVTVLSMSFLLTAKVERYSFVVLPLVFGLGIAGGADVLRALKWLGSVVGAPRSTLGSGLTAATAVVATVALMASMAKSPRAFSLLAARVSGTTTTYQHVDYQRAAAYVAQHRQAGDAFITLAPADVPAYYLGQRPDAIIQTGRSKLLYLVERNGRAVDTIYGAPSILTGAALDTYLSGHLRVWLISDLGGYLQSIPPDLRTSVLSHFRLAYMGAGSSAWLWSP